MAERGRLVCVVGIDGSGKTTLTHSLVAHYAARGVRARYVWCRFESKALARALKAYHAVFSRKHAVKPAAESYKINRGRKSRLFGNPILGRAYERFVVRSYTRQIKRLIVDPLERGETIFCDRYVYDTMVDLALDLKYSHERIHEVANRFFRWAPRPDFTLYVDVPAKVAFERKHDVPHLSYLTDRQAIYGRLREELGFVSVDGTKPPETVLASALAKLDESKVMA